jgi:hypothetical protein
MADSNPAAPAQPTGPPAPAAASSGMSKLAEVAIFFQGLLLTALIAFNVYSTWQRDHPAPPTKPADPVFAKVGRSYGPQLAIEYADAWEQFASSIDAGAPPSKAFAQVAKDFQAADTIHFDKELTPFFGKILADGTKDESVTAAQRAALSAAGRGIAQGLHK